MDEEQANKLLVYFPMNKAHLKKSFADQAKGKSIANQMYNNKADILFACAGDSSLGLLECANETGKYAIGVDRDQNNVAPYNILTSAMKKVNEGVYTVVENLKDGKFDGGKILVFGLKEEGIGLAPSTDKNVPGDVIDYVNGKIEKMTKFKPLFYILTDINVY